MVGKKVVRLVGDPSSTRSGSSLAALVWAAVTPIVILVGTALAFMINRFAITLSALVVIVILRLSRKYVRDYERVTGVPGRSDFAVERAYLRFHADRAEISRRTVFVIVYGLWGLVVVAFSTPALLGVFS